MMSAQQTSITASHRRNSSGDELTTSIQTVSSTAESKNSSPSIKGGILRRSRGGNGSDSNNSNDAPLNTTSSHSPTMCDAEQKMQDRRVCMLRGAMISTLLSATVVVATLTYVFVRKSEYNTFVNQYSDSVSKVAEAFQHGLDSKHDVARTFSAIYTSNYGNAVYDPPIWPNATMPDFQAIAEGQLRLATGRALSFNPIITQDVNRLEWEAHATESASILGAPQLITPEPGTTWPDNRTVAFGIYSRDPETREVIYDPGYAPSSVYPAVMVPVWQIAPIVTNEKAVMFNLHSEPNRMRALDDMLTYRVNTLTAILQLVQDSELRPSSIYFAPVFDKFIEDDEDAENFDDNLVVGSISVVFSWDDMLARILPNYIKGLICVLQSSIGQEFTYSISGDSVTLMGEGDLHDENYDDFERVFNANLAGVDAAYAVASNLITYSLTMYPSQEFQNEYVTNKAAIYTAVVVLIFICTAGLFLLYDYLVENRQQKTVRLARQTSNIVDSMFPASFRDRLYKSTAGASPAGLSRRSSNISEADSVNTFRASNTKASKSSKRMSVSKSLMQMDRFMKLNARNSDPNLELQEDEPIADLFLDTSIMFSDIVGFTKWSSERSPHEVFKLLERLFWEFDDIAERQNVFKLGTIGDCYIAVTGIPDPIDDHATLLTQFAFECRTKVREVCSDLEAEGLDTAKLDMRFGIHSGAITAGILRGTKSRFELFGDTINTASRMESTGESGKIQLSEETAELLRIDNKSSWLIKREDKVTAKGKGTLQTWWAEPVEKRISFHDSKGSLTVDNVQTLGEIDFEDGHEEEVSNDTELPSYSYRYYNDQYENELLKSQIKEVATTADGQNSSNQSKDK